MKHRVLVVDDNPSIHEDFRKILCANTSADSDLAMAELSLFGERPMERLSDFTMDSAYQGQDALALVEQATAEGSPYALAFVDIRMPPGWDGVETVSHLWECSPELQVVICTAYSDYSWDDIIRQLGRSDRLVILKKPFDNVEVLQLAHAMTEKWALIQQVRGRLHSLDELVDQRTRELQELNGLLQREVDERIQAETALRLSEERLSKAFMASPIPSVILNRQTGMYLEASEGFVRMTGFSRKEIIGRGTFELPIWDAPGGQAEVERLLVRERSVRGAECSIRAKGGEVLAVVLSAEEFSLRNEPCVLVMAEDVTERTSLEAQLRQAQKLEAVGQLASGVAHDFNNMLTVVMGQVQLVTDNEPLSEKGKRALSEVSHAGKRAGQLCRQLLTFSRKEAVQLKVLEFNQVLVESTRMLARVLGEHIAIHVETGSELPLVSADPSMLEQVIMNLAVNARDAMADGGKLIFRTSSCQIDSEYTRCRAEARPGTFVCLEVSDTGTGMDAATVEHIFEPFFTTKSAGNGTGLGLATVYGIAKQHGGWIEVASQPGLGTTFKLFFPATDKSPSALVDTHSMARVPGGTESIMVVEDEANVRALVCQVLEGYGYSVIQAADGKEALEVWKAGDGNIDLMLTDMMMPEGISGQDLAKRFMGENPRLKVIYTSGYSPELFWGGAGPGAGARFLPKPFHPKKLAQAVRDSLAA